MKILAFDSCLTGCSIAVADGDKIVAYTADDTPSVQAERLILHIEDTLQEAATAYQDLNAIAVTHGPGSFTGVRIGLAAARGIGLATGLPVIGISTLEAVAMQAIKKNLNADRPVLVMLDARRNQIYTQAFDSQLNALNAPQLSAYDAMPKQIESLKEGCVIASNKPELIKEIITAEGQVQTCPNALLPDARYILQAAWIKIASNGVPSTPPAPLYIRKPDAKLPQQ